MTLLSSFTSSWDRVQARPILLRFTLLCFTDVAFVTNWRQNPPPTKRLPLTLLHLNLPYLWGSCGNPLKLGFPRTPRSQPLGLSHYAFLRILHSHIKWGNGNKSTFLVFGKSRSSVSPAHGFAVLAICTLLSAKIQLNTRDPWRGLDPLNLYQGRA